MLCNITKVTMDKQNKIKFWYLCKTMRLKIILSKMTKYLPDSTMSFVPAPKVILKFPVFTQHYNLYQIPHTASVTAGINIIHLLDI